MVRDGAHRSQVYAGCACYGAPPHYEAEPVESVILRCPRITRRLLQLAHACAGLEGWRPAIAPCSYSALPGPSPFEARPAEEAGLAPQGDGKSESLAAAGSTVILSKDALRSILALA